MERHDRSWLMLGLLVFGILVAAARASGDSSSESPKKRLVVCLDGTWNNPYKEKRRYKNVGIFKPTNVLKTCRAVLPADAEGVPQITYYDPGVGGLNSHPGVSNRVLRWLDGKLGGAWGAGFESHIEDAYRFLLHNYRPGDEIFVFGFSRGAGEARSLCRFIDWMGGFPEKRDDYWVPHFFRGYEESRGDPSRMPDRLVFRRDKLEPIQPARVNFLGVWDTVLALGSRIKAKEGTSVRRRAFHAGESPAAVVEVARQALALDERRYDFRPEIWKRPATPDQSLEQRWFAGVHSNIGGGYVDDGLANVALGWILREAEAVGLALDEKFRRFYPAYPQDALYNSHGFAYRIRETVFGKKNKGVRAIEPEGIDVVEAGLSVDRSVIHRLLADPEEKTKKDCEPVACMARFRGRRPRQYELMTTKERASKQETCCLKHPELDLYRPKNVLEYLSDCSGSEVPDAAIRGAASMNDWLDRLPAECLSP